MSDQNIESLQNDLIRLEKELKLIQQSISPWTNQSVIPSDLSSLLNDTTLLINEKKQELDKLGGNHPVTINILPVEKLAFSVRRWLDLMGYQVIQGNLIDERRFHILAEIKVGRLFQKVLVACIDGLISANEVNRVVEARDAENMGDCWLISERSPLRSSIEQFPNDDSVRVSSFNEFINDLVDFGEYISWLKEYTIGDSESSYYLDHGAVHITVNDEGEQVSEDFYPSIDEYVDDWLNTPGISQMSLLGGFGTGKTWFCKHFAGEQLKLYEKNPNSERLPILINLKDYAKQVSIRNMIVSWMDQHKVKTTASDRFSVFQELR